MQDTTLLDKVYVNALYIYIEYRVIVDLQKFSFESDNYYKKRLWLLDTRLMRGERTLKSGFSQQLVDMHLGRLIQIRLSITDSS